METGKKNAPEIEIQGVTKSYETREGSFLALEEVNLDVEKNEFICVVGPSGCGKTTLMNIIAGLNPPSTGTVKVRGESVTGPGKGKGVVFQQYALYPWLTVEKNVEFGLRMKGVEKEKRREIAQKYIKIVGLEKFAKSYPKELSGGMKQRVAIARAYTTGPEVLLMDEPFSALDKQTINILRAELEAIWEKTKKTILYVTHSVEEAIYFADRVIVMAENPGQIKEIIPIGFPRPRDIEAPEFTALRREILDQVSLSARKSVADEFDSPEVSVL